MSAWSFTDWQVTCDWPACPQHAWATQFAATAGEIPSAARVRKALKRAGWAVNVPAVSIPGFHLKPRLDFCPDHKPVKEG